jgi:hypothetical protein
MKESATHAIEERAGYQEQDFRLASLDNKARFPTKFSLPQRSGGRML